MHLIQKNHSLCEDLPCKGNSNEWKRCRGLLVFILTHWKCYLNNCLSGISLVVQWLRLHSFKAGGLGSIPGRGTKIPHAVRHCQTPPPPATKKNPAFLNSQKVSSLLHIIPTLEFTWKDHYSYYRALHTHIHSALVSNCYCYWQELAPGCFYSMELYGRNLSLHTQWFFHIPAQATQLYHR